MRFLFFYILITLSACAQASGSEQFRVVFYNVENLFDTIKEPGKNDSEYLPDSKRYWNSAKYYKKLNQLSKVISAIGEWQTPALIGMCEVENEQVLNDLTQVSLMRSQGYRFVVSNSKDERGIDVALLYQRDRFKLLGHTCHTIKFTDKKKVSRDLLHVYGQLKNNDTLDVFICHYPSRREGEKASEPYRIQASELLRQKVDSILKQRKEASVIIMGDFNDEPTDKSLCQTLGARPYAEKAERTELYNLSYHLNKDRQGGSYKYQGKWNLLDQIIVSGRILETTSSFSFHPNDCHIYRADFLLTEDKTQGGKRPRRTYHGMKYEGGFSDHLPVYADFYVSLVP